MKIIVNGQAKNISEGIVLSSLLDDLKIDRERIAVEINLEIIKKDRYDSLKLVEGDRIEILQFVGGGESEPKE
ncbi:TPA: thiamine biosynthesis protein ThiS [bacterium]|nr:thiamine biosynthesis protein ThiS [bacterium]